MSYMRKRFDKELDETVKKYTASIHFDKRLYREDIAGSIAHAKMLAKQGIISEKDAELIVMGLVSIREEIENNTFNFKEELEDIHLNIEHRLIEKIGDVGAKLHTARSRNDQVATDMRLFIREAINGTIKDLNSLQSALIDLAEKHIDIIMPGYTHLQRAQPVLFSHHILAYFEMLQRDRERFKDCLQRNDVLPLGSGALAGAPYHLDRDFVCKELGFRELSRNSIDAVSDRDFIVEFVSCSAITMMHLSRLAEEIVLWSSSEFSFINLDDAFTTGSSIMPQKKNPDVAELARGKTGRVYGHLIGLLTTMKALPLSYNRDMQEDKEALFDTVDTLQSTVQVFTKLMGSLKLNRERMSSAAGEGYILATDVADYLVKKGMPFREAHQIVSQLVLHLSKSEKSFKEIGLEEYRRFSDKFDSDILKLSISASVELKNVVGGTSTSQVRKAIETARRIIDEG